MFKVGDIVITDFEGLEERSKQVLAEVGLVDNIGEILQLNSIAKDIHLVRFYRSLTPRHDRNIAERWLRLKKHYKITICSRSFRS